MGLLNAITNRTTEEGVENVADTTADGVKFAVDPAGIGSDLYGRARDKDWFGGESSDSSSEPSSDLTDPEQYQSDIADSAEAAAGSAEDYGDYDRGGMRNPETGESVDNQLTYDTSQYGEVAMTDEMKLIAPDNFELGEDQAEALGRNIRRGFGWSDKVSDNTPPDDGSDVVEGGQDEHNRPNPGDNGPVGPRPQYNPRRSQGAEGPRQSEMRSAGSSGGTSPMALAAAGAGTIGIGALVYYFIL